MRSHFTYSVVGFLVVSLCFGCLVTDASSQSLCRSVALYRPSGLDLPNEIPKSDDAMLSTITELMRERQGTEPPRERVAEALFRAKTIWSEAINEAEKAEAIAAHEIAEQIREETEFLARIDLSDPVGVLMALQDTRVHPFELVSSGEAFAPFFEREIEGPTINWGELVTAENPPDGATLVFSAGAHKCYIKAFQRGYPFPRDVVIQGEGMDKTLIQVQEIETRCTIRNLTFRDLTIDCGNEYMTDLRGDAPAIIRLQRCRVIRPSVVLGADTAAFLAEDSVFEAGFGRHAGSEAIFRVSDGLLARLERCVIKGPFHRIYYPDQSSTYVFADCRFEDVPSDFKRQLEVPGEGVRFQGCTATYMPREDIRELYRDGPRPITDLNPDWVLHDESR